MNIHGEEPIISKLSHQYYKVKSNVNISLWKRKYFQCTDSEEIGYRFNHIILGVSDFEVCIWHKPIVPNNIWASLKVTQHHLWKEDLFVQYVKNKNINLLSVLLPIKYIPKVVKVLRSIIAPSAKTFDCFYDCTFHIKLSWCMKYSTRSTQSIVVFVSCNHWISNS